MKRREDAETVAVGYVSEAHASGVEITHVSVDRGSRHSTLFIQMEYDADIQEQQALHNALTWTFEAISLTTGIDGAITDVDIGDIKPFAEGRDNGRALHAFSLRTPSTVWRSSHEMRRCAAIAANLAASGRNPRGREEGQGYHTTISTQLLVEHDEPDQSMLVQANTSVWVGILERERNLKPALLASDSNAEGTIAEHTVEWIRSRTQWSGWEAPADRGGVRLASYDGDDPESRTVWTMRKRDGTAISAGDTEKVMALLTGESQAQHTAH